MAFLLLTLSSNILAFSIFDLADTRWEYQEVDYWEYISFSDKGVYFHMTWPNDERDYGYYVKNIQLSSNENGKNVISGIRNGNTVFSITLEAEDCLLGSGMTSPSGCFRKL